MGQPQLWDRHEMCTNLSFLVSPHRLVSRKSTHGQSTLQISQTQGYTLFRVSPHLTTKEHPCHVYSDLTTANNWTEYNIQRNHHRHATLWTAPWHHEECVSNVYTTCAAALAVSLLQTGIRRAKPVSVKQRQKKSRVKSSRSGVWGLERSQL